MKTNKFILITLFSIGFIQAQDTKLLSLQEAIKTGITSSNQAILADTKVKTSEWELKTVKNIRKLYNAKLLFVSSDDKIGEVIGKEIDDYFKELKTTIKNQSTEIT